MDTICKLKIKISTYLIDIIDTYFHQWTIGDASNTAAQINGGVPQGSVIDPTLWNFLYNGIVDLETKEVKLMC